jgi:glycosyltransferase 2 family protein
LKKSQWLLGVVVLAAIAVLGLYAQHRYQFNWHEVITQLSKADWRKICIAIASIYIAYVFRSARWACLLRHSKKVGPFSLLGTQIIGFTAVALIGRVADPVRPYLVSKKTELPLANQLAVYVVERLFDMGTMALIFSVAMLWIPTNEIVKATGSFSNVQAHPLLASFIARYSGLMLTLLGAAFLLVARFSGESLATFFERSLGAVSKRLGHSIGQKIRAFHTGLGAMQSINDLAAVAALSLGMWLFIAFAYFICCRAFVAAPELATMTPQKSVLLMIASGGASLFQLPVIGWFTQIIAVAAVLSAGFGVAKEAATAGAATLLLVTFLCIVPVGLIWAHFEHVSLRKVTVESEHAEEVLAASEPADQNIVP